MLADYIYDRSAAKYADRILLIDADHLTEDARIADILMSHGFEVIQYHDDLSFRIGYEKRIKSNEGRIAVIAQPNQYIPYDLRCRLTASKISLSDLFPRLDASTLKRYSFETYDLLSLSYTRLHDYFTTEAETERFIRDHVLTKENYKDYLNAAYSELLKTAEECADYKGWFAIASKKARIDCLAVAHEIDVDTEKINILFKDFILSQYGKLSTTMDHESPVLVSRAMEFIHSNSGKFVIIVMDGMSEFDWLILSKSFDGITYRQSAAFAMIPTVTSVSRQCLLSNKFPRELENPWSQNKEKQEFITCAKNMGFAESRISYQRGYDADFGSLIRCGAVIVNDIDDVVHGQRQGRAGMYNDISILAKQAKLADMTRRFISSGFDVYITADHGNTTRRGMGKLMSCGVETETKSRCMIVLKEFADKNALMEKYNLLEFPKTYLPKEFDYLICDVGASFDAKGEAVMSHGGISIDECVVPFIKIKAVENNG